MNALQQIEALEKELASKIKEIKEANSTVYWKIMSFEESAKKLAEIRGQAERERDEANAQK